MDDPLELQRVPEVRVRPLSRLDRPQQRRRLAAILAADVAGFSGLMERDEEGTHSRVRALRKEVIEVALREHAGRLVKTMGDGFLAEFASPVEAVRAAIAIQERTAEREAAKAEPLRLRIGINLGDIIVEEDGDVYGDGVNIAARLEQVALELDLVALGDALGYVEHRRRRQILIGHLVGQLVLPSHLDHVDRHQLGGVKLRQLAAQIDHQLIGRTAVEAEHGLVNRIGVDALRHWPEGYHRSGQAAVRRVRTVGPWGRSGQSAGLTSSGGGSGRSSSSRR